MRTAIQRVDVIGRQRLLELEACLKDMPQEEIPIRHIFSRGIYAREMTMPKGCIVIGKIHLFEHLCFIQKGVVKIVTEAEDFVITAPSVFCSPKGTKRALYAIEETIFTTVHATSERNIEVLEATLVADEYTPDLLQLLGGV